MIQLKSTEKFVRWSFLRRLSIITFIIIFGKFTFCESAPIRNMIKRTVTQQSDISEQSDTCDIMNANGMECKDGQALELDVELHQIRRKREYHPPPFGTAERNHTCEFLMSNRTLCGQGPFLTTEFTIHQLLEHGVLNQVILDNSDGDYIPFTWSQTDNRKFYINQCSTVEDLKEILKQWIRIEGDFELRSWSNTSLSTCRTLKSYNSEILDQSDPSYPMYRVDIYSGTDLEDSTCSMCNEDNGCVVENVTPSRSKRARPTAAAPTKRAKAPKGDPPTGTPPTYPPMPNHANIVNTRHHGDEEFCIKNFKKYKEDDNNVAQETARTKFTLWKINKNSYRTVAIQKDHKVLTQLVVCLSQAFIDNNPGALADNQPCKVEEIEEFKGSPRVYAVRGSPPGSQKKKKVKPYFLISRFRCGHCKGLPAFKQFSDLDIHISAVHEKARTFICDRQHERTSRINYGKALRADGTMAFTTQDNRNHHVKQMHPDGDTFDCPECHKSFGDQNKLYYHYAIHSTLKPFACLEENCEYGPYKSKYHLAQHVKEQHAAEGRTGKQQCPTCQAWLFHTALDWHKLAHSKNRDFNCKLCDPEIFYEELEDWKNHLASETHIQNFGGTDISKPRPTLADPDLYSDKVQLIYAENGVNPFALYTDDEKNSNHAHYANCPQFKDKWPKDIGDKRGAVQRWYRPNVIGVRYREYEYVVTQEMRCKDTTYYLYIEVVPEDLCGTECKEAQCQNKYYIGMSTTELGHRESQHFHQSSPDGQLAHDFFTDCKEWIVFVPLYTTQDLIIPTASGLPNKQPALDALWYAERTAIKLFKATKRVAGRDSEYWGTNKLPGGPYPGSQEELEWKLRMNPA